MDTTMQNSLKKALRDHFGACEIRFNETCVTVTLINDFGKFNADLLREQVDMVLEDNGWLMAFTTEVVTSNRFKLKKVLAEELYQARHEDDSTIDEQADIDELRGTIAGAVGGAHDAEQLEQLLMKEIEHDMEDHIATNLPAALVILERSKMVISLDETKQLMRFSYLSGLWKNARERDLQVLAKAFNKYFEKYAQSWSLQSDEVGNG